VSRVPQVYQVILALAATVSLWATCANADPVLTVIGTLICESPAESGFIVGPPRSKCRFEGLDRRTKDRFYLVRFADDFSPGRQGRITVYRVLSSDSKANVSVDLLTGTYVDGTGGLDGSIRLGPFPSGAVHIVGTNGIFASIVEIEAFPRV
jgi:hypothetical protein